jgi:FKBP-type peptidyl-prolyl cis-trans isomerase
MARPPSRRPLALALAATLGGTFAAFLAFALAGCARDAAATPTRTLASGLRIDELRAGVGAAAGDGSWVEVHYDARVAAPSASGDAHAAAGGGGGATPPFDSTRRGDPFVFRIGHSKVLAALSEGVTGMQEGGRRRLTLPPDLGYGALGKGPVPPDATLEYDVELVHLFARSKSGVDHVERKRGAGARPAAGQKVVIRCREWLVETGRSILDPKQGRDGFVVEVGAGQAIPALDAALPEMNVGSVWRIGVPPELGYGVNGHLPILVPGQDCVLDLELVAIKEKP